MTRSIQESENFLIHQIERTLSWLGLSPEDVEIVLGWSNPRFAAVNWSAQTSLGDLVGTFQVPTNARLEAYPCRQAVAETALTKLRAADTQN